MVDVLDTPPNRAISGGIHTMNTVRNLGESDEEGTVHVNLPVGAPHRQIEEKRAELEALAGALADDPIVRPPQPALEVRLPVE
jgi:hypothetical protein